MPDTEQYTVMAKIAQEAAREPDPMQVVTKFGGTRVDPSVRGSITNISENNFTPAGMIYGFMDGIVQELYDWYEIIHKGTGMGVRTLLGSGNGVRKNTMLQTAFSEKFGLPLALSRYEEEAASGAAVSCTLAL